MPQKRQGFTTMVDLAEFEKTTWAFLVNIKMTWQYDGMAYLFREAGIPLYGIDRGTGVVGNSFGIVGVTMLVAAVIAFTFPRLRKKEA